MRQEEWKSPSIIPKPEPVFSSQKTPVSHEAALSKQLNEKAREISAKGPKDAANVVKIWLQAP